MTSLRALDPRLYVITDRLDDGLPARAEAALSAGATTLQLRLKGCTARQTLAAARALKPLCAAHRATFIVNDRLDLALAAGADGVHLGPDDLPVAQARRLAPEGFLIGASAGSAEVARALVAEGADHLGVGAIFDARASKADASAPRGLEVLRAVRDAVSVPIVAIGGVTQDNAADCLLAGASGVAIIRAIMGAGSPAAVRAATRSLRLVIDGALKS